MYRLDYIYKYILTTKIPHLSITFFLPSQSLIGVYFPLALVPSLPPSLALVSISPSFPYSCPLSVGALVVSVFGVIYVHGAHIRRERDWQQREKEKGREMGNRVRGAAG